MVIQSYCFSCFIIKTVQYGKVTSLCFNLALTVVVSFVADYVRFNCQTATILMRATNVEFATTPAIKFTTC